MIERIVQFLQEVKQELRKVVWPPKKHTFASSSVVLVFVFIIAFFLGFIDLIIAKIVKLVLS